MSEEYQVAFQARTTFQKMYVNIAVDDIQVSHGLQCQDVTTPTTQTPVTTATYPSIWDCDFETGTCSWTMDRSTGSPYNINLLKLKPGCLGAFQSTSQP